MKPVAEYRRGSLLGIPNVGWPTNIQLVSHHRTNPIYAENPSYLFDGDIATTSAVMSYDERTGEFETQNTKYIPVD